MNERLRTEADILHRQKSGSELLAENLKLMQHELEKAQSSSRMRLENENSDLREELGLVRKKKDQDHTEFMASMKAWEASTTEMRNDLETSKEAERIATIKVERSIADIEELNQRITGKVFFSYLTQNPEFTMCSITDDFPGSVYFVHPLDGWVGRVLPI